VIEASILDPTALDHALHGADGIVHLAALPSVARSVTDPIATHEANASGTLQVLEAARRQKVRYIAVASSSSVYGANQTIPKTEDLAPMPMSPYAVSKLAAESYALAYAACFELEVLALRFFNVYGPFQRAGHAYAAVIPTFVAAALDEEPLTINGDGLQTRDFTFVGSVETVIVEALRHRISCPRPVNLAFGTRTSLLDLVSELETVLGCNVTVRHAATRVGDVLHSQADFTQLAQLFPDVGPVSLREGLSTTVDWFKSEAEQSTMSRAD
jgi:UDP-glucose 4-epimerase